VQKNAEAAIENGSQHSDVRNTRCAINGYCHSKRTTLQIDMVIVSAREMISRDGSAVRRDGAKKDLSIPAAGNLRSVRFDSATEPAITATTAQRIWQSSFRIDSVTAPGWRNWQTQRTQNPPRATSWGFDPPSRHQNN
jgi:hypothetical protein